MALAITGTGNGSLNNLALSANTGTILDTKKAGTVIQFVNASTQTNTSTTSTSYIDVGLSASITPTSSSNKIVVHLVASLEISRAGDAFSGGARILRDSTVIYTPPDDSGPISPYFGAFGAGLSLGIFRHNYAMLVCDSPPTTSSVTY